MGCLQNLDAIENPGRIIVVGCTSLKSQRILGLPLYKEGCNGGFTQQNGAYSLIALYSTTND
jgi:hypothetical protein